MTGAAELGSQHDFDFLHGRWGVTHRRLKRRLVGDASWDEYSSTASCDPILDGVGNIEQIDMPSKGYSGATLRLFNPVRKEWSLYWADSRSGTLFPAVVGRFQNGEGLFHGEDTDNGVPVQVRFLWSRITPNSARWEQAFSTDGGESWETNWTMAFVRSDG